MNSGFSSIGEIIALNHDNYDEIMAKVNASNEKKRLEEEKKLEEEKRINELNLQKEQLQEEYAKDYPFVVSSYAFWEKYDQFIRQFLGDMIAYIANEKAKITIENERGEKEVIEIPKYPSYDSVLKNTIFGVKSIKVDINRHTPNMGNDKGLNGNFFGDGIYKEFFYDHMMLCDFFKDYNLGEIIEYPNRRLQILWNEGVTLNDLINAYAYEYERVEYYKNSKDEWAQECDGALKKVETKYSEKITPEFREFLSKFNGNINNLSILTIYYLQELQTKYNEFNFDILDENHKYALFLRAYSTFIPQIIETITNVNNSEQDKLLDFYNNHYVSNKLILNR